METRLTVNIEAPSPRHSVCQSTSNNRTKGRCYGPDHTNHSIVFSAFPIVALEVDIKVYILSDLPLGKKVSDHNRYQRQ